MIVLGGFVTKNPMASTLSLLLSGERLKTGENFFNFAYIYWEIFFKKEYDLGLDLNGKVIFDVGGNMGLFSLWLNQNFKGSKIHFFEPVEQLFKIAEFNLKRSQNTFFLNQAGLGKEKQESKINFYPLANGFSSLKEDLIQKVNGMPWFKRILVERVIRRKILQDIQIISAADYIEREKIERIDFCKIDAEGLELEILLGFRDKINIVHTFIIEVEQFREGVYQEILRTLKDFELNLKSSGPNCSVLVARNLKLN